MHAPDDKSPPSSSVLGRQLAGVQETLFIPLVARAQESSRKRPLLRGPEGRGDGLLDRNGHPPGTAEGPARILRHAPPRSWTRGCAPSWPATLPGRLWRSAPA